MTRSGCRQAVETEANTDSADVVWSSLPLFRLSGCDSALTLPSPGGCILYRLYKKGLLICKVLLNRFDCLVAVMVSLLQTSLTVLACMYANIITSLRHVTS